MTAHLPAEWSDLARKAAAYDDLKTACRLLMAYVSDRAAPDFADLEWTAHARAAIARKRGSA